MSQEAYIDSVLDRFDMSGCAGVSTPIVARLSAKEMGNALSPEDHERYRALIGSLVYVSAWSRPDIAFALSELSRFVRHLVPHIFRRLSICFDISRPPNTSH